MADIPNHPFLRHPPRIRAAVDAEPRAFLGSMTNAGFEVVDDLHDDYVVIRDPGTGVVIMLIGGDMGRVTLRSCISCGVREQSERLAALEAAVRDLNRTVWGKLRCDEDGDVVVEHVYLLATGVLESHLNYSIRYFASLVDWLARHLRDRGLIERGASRRESGGSDSPRSEGRCDD